MQQLPIPFPFAASRNDSECNSMFPSPESMRGINPVGSPRFNECEETPYPSSACKILSQVLNKNCQSPYHGKGTQPLPLLILISTIPPKFRKRFMLSSEIVLKSCDQRAGHAGCASLDSAQWAAPTQRSRDWTRSGPRHKNNPYQRP